MVEYKDLLYKDLKDVESSAAYLAEVFETESYSTFLVALNDVVEARIGEVSTTEQASDIRKSLKEISSANEYPRLSSLNDVLTPLGLKLTVSTFRADEDKEVA